METLKQVIDKLYGIPCWKVKRGAMGTSFITLEFGQPHVTDGGVHDVPARLARGKQLRCRHMYLHGEWHLWVYCCGWDLTCNGEELAQWGSDDEDIDWALDKLEGQALMDVAVDAATGSTRFFFDLGAVLRVYAYDSDLLELWFLFDPTGYVLTVRSDGNYCYAPGSTRPSEKDYRPL